MDADTLILRLSMGLGVEFTHPRGVRLLGIDCPERYTDPGKLASQFVAEWIVSAEAAGNPWPLTVETTGYDKYGRVLGSVKRNDTGASLKDDLMANGHGTAIAMLSQLPPKEAT